jgi:hypothetical protein
MSRMIASIVVGIGLLGAVPRAGAQMPMVDPYGLEDFEYIGSPAAYPDLGGVGLGYSQSVRAGGVVMDRFGMPHAAPSPGARVSARAPRARARAPQARAGSARPRYQLPTGSLYWPDAGGVMLYSPLERHRSYGDGYGNGPYGSADHGIMYKGWSLDY